MRTKATMFMVMLLAPLTALGHTCANTAGLSEKDFQKYLDKQKAIFFGEVVHLEPPVGPRQRIRVRVLQSWKGLSYNDFEVSLSYTGAYDSFGAEIGGIGTQKMFYAGEGANGELSITYCGFQTKALDDRVKQKLGEGMAIKHLSEPKAPEEDSFWTWLWKKIASVFS